jgi:hypothetical protein
MTTDHVAQLLAETTANSIIHLLNGRKGFDDWFYSCDSGVRQEIEDAVARCIYAAASTSDFLENAERAGYARAVAAATNAWSQQLGG